MAKPLKDAPYSNCCLRKQTVKAYANAHGRSVSARSTVRSMFKHGGVPSNSARSAPTIVPVRTATATTEFGVHSRTKRLAESRSAGTPGTRQGPRHEKPLGARTGALPFGAARLLRAIPTLSAFTDAVSRGVGLPPVQGRRRRVASYGPRGALICADSCSVLGIRTEATSDLPDVRDTQHRAMVVSSGREGDGA